jgi:Flp pilus assembly protein TadD
VSARRGFAAPAAGSGAPRRFLGLLVAGLLLAAFWAVFLPQAERSVFGRAPILDEIYYLDRAAAPADPTEPAYMSPLYPRLIELSGSAPADPTARVYRPEQLRGIRLVQFGCWLGIVALLRVMAGRHLASLVPGGWKRTLVVWLPAALFALYRPAAVYAVTILLDVPLAFLVTVFLALATWDATWRVDPAAKPAPAWPVVARAALLGVVVGLATLLRGTSVALLPVGMAAAAWPARPAAAGARAGSRAHRAVAVAAVVLGALVVLAPAAARNSKAAGRLVGPALNGGVNLYIGNGPEANGFYVAVVPGSWLLDPAGRAFLAERFDRPSVSLAQADSLWADAALASIRQHPARAAGLWLRKVRLHLQGWEIDQLTTIDGWTNSAPSLRALVAPYALIAVLGLVGLAGAWRLPASRWWAVVLLALLAVQSVFFVVSRYRLALVPALALLAGLAIARLLGDGLPRARQWRAWAPWLVAVLLVVPWGLGNIRRDWKAMAAANEALRWAQVGSATHDDGSLARAEALYRQALVGKAGGPAPWLGLAMVQYERGDAAGAEKTLLEGCGAVSQNLDLLKQVIRLQLEQKRRDEAYPRVLQALQAHPRDVDLLHLSAVLSEQAGRREQALAAARELRRWHPGNPQAYVDLGILLARGGSLAEAADVFREGLRVAPGHPDLTTNLAKVVEDLQR